MPYLNWCGGETTLSRITRLVLYTMRVLTNWLIKCLPLLPKRFACASDTLALGVIKRLQELQREDVVVTGVGGNDLLSFLFPRVFSIDPGYQSAGALAAKLLISQLLGQTPISHHTQKPIV